MTREAHTDEALEGVVADAWAAGYEAGSMFVVTDQERLHADAFSYAKNALASRLATITPGREVVARAIDPAAWRWKPLPREPNEAAASKAAYDEQDRSDTAAVETAKRVALAKADRIIALFTGKAETP